MIGSDFLPSSKRRKVWFFLDKNWKKKFNSTYFKRLFQLTLRCLGIARLFRLVCRQTCLTARKQEGKHSDIVRRQLYYSITIVIVIKVILFMKLKIVLTI